MKFFSFSIGALLAASAAQVNAACHPLSSDMTAIKFGYSVQKLLASYYESVPVNHTSFAMLPDNITAHTDLVSNVQGLKRQAHLGTHALQQLASKGSMHAQMPNCAYRPPKPASAKEHLMYAMQIEATLCGTFIGLADYVQCPETAFLMARLAAGHGNHAGYMMTLMKEHIYMPNSTSLLPAFTPQQVMTSGMGIGHLGQWMNNCTTVPSAPCGGQVMIGNLGSNLTNANGSMPSVSHSTMPVVTGSASTFHAALNVVVGVAIGAALI